jgi:hypothetical protein
VLVPAVSVSLPLALIEPAVGSPVGSLVGSPVGSVLVIVSDELVPSATPLDPP